MGPTAATRPDSLRPAPPHRAAHGAAVAAPDADDRAVTVVPEPEAGSQPSRESSPKPPVAPAPTPTPPPVPAPKPVPAPAPPDTVAPQTSAWTVSAANGFWTIGLSADEPATFECSLDGGGWTSCSSPLAYAGMHPGPHTFAARATDSAGNTDPTPATLSIKFTGNGSGH